MIKPSSSISVQKQTTAVSSAFDMTPLIDIVFIMIVFLILCINQPITSLPFDLPNSGSSRTPVPIPQASTIKLFDEAPYYGLQDSRYQSSQVLISRLKETAPFNSNQVQLASASNTPAYVLLELLEQLKASGFDATNILMEKQ